MKIRYIGELLDHSGYGEAARQNVALLDRMGHKVECIPTGAKKSDDPDWKFQTVLRCMNNKHSIPDLIITHIYPPQNIEKYRQEDVPLMAYLAWETDMLSSIWAYHLNKWADYVVTTCTEMQMVFKKSGVEKPVYVLGPTIFDEDLQVIRTNSPSYEELPQGFQQVYNKDKYIFYGIFQWIERKDPKKLTSAFIQEFDMMEDVMLLMKSYRVDYSEGETKKMINSVNMLNKELNIIYPPEVRIIPHRLSQTEISLLHRMGDCYVTPHRGEGTCSLYNTPVATINGQKPLGDITKGELVQTHTGEYYPVTELFSRKYNDELVNIHPFYIDGKIKDFLPVTPNHPIHVATIKQTSRYKHLCDMQYSDIDLGYKNADELVAYNDQRIYDFLVIPKHYCADKEFHINIADYVDSNSFYINDQYITPIGKCPVTHRGHGKPTEFRTFEHKKGRLPRDINDGLLYTIGLYIAEGSFGDGPCFSVHHNEDYIKDAIDDFVANNKIEAIVSDRFEARHRRQITINNTLLGNIFKELCGNGAHNKQLPYFTRILSEVQLYQLLKGMYHGDGSNYMGRQSCVYEVSYTTVSWKLAFGLWQLLMAIGIVSRLKTRVHNDGTLSYQIITKGQFMVQLLKILEWKPKYYHKQFKTNTIVLSDKILIPIRSVTKRMYKGKVHNIGVDVDNTYVLGGVAVHNCLPIIDAVLHENPVICTPYGGPQDFTDSKCSRWLDYKLIPIQNPLYCYNYFNAYMQWADVDIMDLRRAMRFMFEQRDVPYDCGMTGRNPIRAKDKLLKVYGYKNNNRIATMILKDIK